MTYVLICSCLLPHKKLVEGERGREDREGFPSKKLAIRCLTSLA